MTIEDVARICYEAERVYCLATGEKTLPWPELKPSERNLVKEAVRIHVKNPDRLPSAAHDHWLAVRKKAGWTHGVVKDPYRKQDPGMVPYGELPEMQRVKDRLFVAIVDTLRRNVRDE